jgi:hypothetical protein
MARRHVMQRRYTEQEKTLDGYDVVEGVEVATIDDKTGETTYFKKPLSRKSVRSPTNVLWGGFK